MLFARDQTHLRFFLHVLINFWFYLRLIISVIIYLAALKTIRFREMLPQFKVVINQTSFYDPVEYKHNIVCWFLLKCVSIKSHSNNESVTRSS